MCAYGETQRETILCNKQFDILLHDVSYGRTHSTNSHLGIGIQKKRKWRKGRGGQQRSEFGHNPAVCVGEEAIFVISQKCPYHMTFDLNLDFEHIQDTGQHGDHHVQV